MNPKMKAALGVIFIVALACSLSDLSGNNTSQPVSQTYTPSIRTDPLGGPPGTTHDIYFDGFPPNAELYVEIQSNETGEVVHSFNLQIDPQGYGYTYFTSPTDANFGSHFIYASGTGFNSPVSGQFIVAPEDSGQFPAPQDPDDAQPQQNPSPGQPAVVVQPNSGPPGTYHDVYVSGFPSNAELVVEFLDPNSNLLLTFEIVSNIAGSGQAWIETSTDASPGTHYLYISGPAGVSASTTVLVIGSNQAPPQDPGITIDDAEFDAVMNALVTNLQVYWSLNFNKVWPEYANQYEGVEVYSYTAPADLEGCNVPANETANNAFYCFSVNRVYFDENWFKTNYAKYGKLFPAYLIAHEFGHAAQDVIGMPGTLSIDIEAQADCFTGAYFAWGEDQGYYTQADISTISYTMIPNELAESHWTWTGESAHGGGLRIGFFGEGYGNGLDFCKTFP